MGYKNPNGTYQRTEIYQEGNKNPNPHSCSTKTTIRVHWFSSYLIVCDRVNPFKRKYNLRIIFNQALISNCFHKNKTYSSNAVFIGMNPILKRLEGTVAALEPFLFHKQSWSIIRLEVNKVIESLLVGAFASCSKTLYTKPIPNISNSENITL